MFKRIYFDNKSRKIHLWETYNGKESKLVEDFEYSYYVNDSSGQSPVKTNTGKPVVQQKTRSKKRLQNLRDAGMQLYESDINEEVQFLQERYGNVDLEPDIKDYKVAVLDIEVESEFEFPKPEEAKYPINLITVYNSKTGKYFTWGLRPYNGNSELVQFYKCIPNEKEMLTDFINWFRKNKFDIITGWYVKDFDIHYILQRKENLEIKENLTEMNSYFHSFKIEKRINEKTGKITKKKVYYCRIPGINILDSLELYDKFTFVNLPSYNLQYVSTHLGLEGKVDLIGQVNNEWKNNWDRFVEYNIMDVILVKQIDEITKHIALAIQYASQALIQIDRVFSSLATVEGYILRDLRKKQIVMDDKKRNIKDRWRDEKLYLVDGYIQNLKDGEKMFEPFFIKGAFVHAKGGLYKNLMSFDITSLYPHNMIQYNISPEVKVFNPSPERIAKGDLIKTPINGIYYLKNQRGIIPEVVEKIFNERKEFKKLKFKYINEGNQELGKFYDAQQHIRKILINSFYGCLANKHSHFYDVDNARVITRGGRELIKFLSNTTNRFFKEVWHKEATKYFPDVSNCKKIEKDLVVVIDTDSNYLCLDEVKEKYAPDMDLMEFCHKMENEVLNPFYEKILKIWADKYNAKQVIDFKREDIIAKQLVLAKKKYIKLVLQSEDEIFEEPDFHATGGEIVKSDVPPLCRQLIKDVVMTIFDGDVPSKTKVMAKLKEIKKDFPNHNIEEISFNKSVSEYTKYAKETSWYVNHGNIVIKPSTPMHVRASMQYNFMVEKFNLPYTPIGNGGKLKYVHVDKKNILGTDVVAYVGNWPHEFDNYFKIDYRIQFQKSFLNAIQGIFDVMNWGVINFKSGGLSKFMKKK